MKATYRWHWSIFSIKMPKMKRHQVGRWWTSVKLKWKYVLISQCLKMMSFPPLSVPFFAKFCENWILTLRLKFMTWPDAKLISSFKKRTSQSLAKFPFSYLKKSLTLFYLAKSSLLPFKKRGSPNQFIPLKGERVS